MHMRFLDMRDTQISVTLLNSGSNSGPNSGPSDAIIDGFEESKEIFIIRLVNPLAPGKIYSLSILNFKAMPTNELRPDQGLYFNSFGQSWSLTTFFQTRNARTAFPCLDHPLLKATFEVCVEHENSATAVGNTPISAAYGTRGGATRTCFRRTPKLPTYLVSFAILSGYEKEMAVLDGEISMSIFYPREFDPNNFKWAVWFAQNYFQRARNFINSEYCTISKISITTVTHFFYRNPPIFLFSKFSQIF